MCEEDLWQSLDRLADKFYFLIIFFLGVMKSAAWRLPLTSTQRRPDWAFLVLNVDHTDLFHGRRQPDWDFHDRRRPDLAFLVINVDQTEVFRWLVTECVCVLLVDSQPRMPTIDAVNAVHAVNVLFYWCFHHALLLYLEIINP